MKLIDLVEGGRVSDPSQNSIGINMYPNAEMIELILPYDEENDFVFPLTFEEAVGLCKKLIKMIEEQEEGK